MNFQQARAAAEEAARGLASGVASCPSTERTGLIVLVYGGADGDALTGVPVSVNGGAPRPTDESGLARFIPIAAGDHTVHADRPEGAPELLMPSDEPAVVLLGQCPICMLHIPAGVIPELTILWAHDDGPVANVELEIQGSGAPKRSTTELGVATWVLGVRPGPYDVVATFPDGASYLLFQGAVASRRVDLSTARHTLKIKRNLVTFRVQKQVGAAFEELVDARVKLREPDKELTTALDGGQALAKLTIPVVRADQPLTCEVVSLTPDATDDVYEVVEVTSV